MRSCAGDEGRPFDVALRGEASNRPMLRWLKTVVVSDGEKAYKMRQVGIGKTFREWSGKVKPRKTSLLRRRNLYDDTESRGSPLSVTKPGGCPSIGQVVSGVEMA